MTRAYINNDGRIGHQHKVMEINTNPFTPRLEFIEPEFHEGINLTVRRGLKWANYNKQFPVLVTPVNKAATIVDVKVMTFDSLTDEDLILEHSPDCRSYDGLYQTMRNIYPGFDSREVVTLLTFRFD